MTRGGPGRATAAALVGLALANGAVWSGAFLFLRPASPPATAVPVPAMASPSAPAEEAADLLPVFATSDGVAVRLVSAEVVAVAFHEASYHDATALRPMGVCRPCRNRTKFSPPEPRDRDLAYIVTDSRGRTTPATSAADIVLRRGAEVMAPVSGVVTRVKRYRLYSRYRDVRVEIRPEGVPDRRVILLHLARVPVRPGDPVEASVTVLGGVRRFGFESQVDRYVRGRYPHVHLEVKDPAARRTSKTS